MARTDDDTAVERDALKMLLESDGWQVFQGLVLSEWDAEATLAKQDQALKAIERGDFGGVSDTVQQIQAARKAVLAVMQLPRMRLQQLAPAADAKGPFSGFRRIAR